MGKAQRFFNVTCWLSAVHLVWNVCHPKGVGVIALLTITTLRKQPQASCDHWTIQNQTPPQFSSTDTHSEHVAG